MRIERKETDNNAERGFLTVIVAVADSKFPIGGRRDVSASRKPLRFLPLSVISFHPQLCPIDPYILNPA